MSDHARREYPAFIGIQLPISMLERMDAYAPTSRRARSAFVREAIRRELDRLERETARPPAELDEPAGAR
jgi:metal-responsive CopG/Arc/MetJ family transcriptional regulator